MLPGYCWTQFAHIISPAGMIDISESTYEIYWMKPLSARDVIEGPPCQETFKSQFLLRKRNNKKLFEEAFSGSIDLGVYICGL